MKVFPIDIKSYTEFFQKEAYGANIYTYPSWFFGMSSNPVVLGCLDDNDQLMAVWPFNKVKRSLGAECLSQPIFCQSLGPVFAQHLLKNRSENAVESLQRKIILYFFKHIRRNGYSCLSQGLPVDFKMAHYFHHFGAELNYRITYRIDSNLSSEALWGKIHSDHRRKIKNSQDRNILTEDCPAEKLWLIKKEGLNRAQLSMLPNRNKFTTAVNDMKKIGQGWTIGLMGKDDKWKSMAFFGEDAETVYYLVGCTVKKSSGESPSLPVLWAGIKKALDKGKNFDFEGTMVPQLDRNFRRFDPKPVPYARLEWDKSCTGQLKSAWKKWRSAKRK